MKERLDILLVKKGYFNSREKARSSIMAGVVFVNDKREDKPGTKFNEDADIYVKENIHPYVSRGGLKLEKALSEFKISLDNKVAMDVGASTGGFTDCMLKNGIKKVYAVDVGYGQLAWQLRNHNKVVCMERTNIRYVKQEDLDELIDICTIDVSFISLKKVLPPLMALTTERAEFVCLIKPQFEAGKEKVGKRGVVRDIETHREVVRDIVFFAMEMGLEVFGLTFSPIKGPEGNIEYIVYLKKGKDTDNKDHVKDLIHEVVNKSHKVL